jgi:hypothetical protein
MEQKILTKMNQCTACRTAERFGIGGEWWEILQGPRHATIEK